MLSIYPFGSGSLYTASYASTASYAPSASLITYANSSSKATTVLNPQSGSNGKNVCLISYEDYLKLLLDSSKRETCTF